MRLFAGLRERAGWSERELDGVARVGDVWAALGLGPEPDGLLYAVNKEYARRERELADGDEVALIPPVSGGSFRLSGEPLSLDAVVDEVRSDRAGAIATFVGTTTPPTFFFPPLNIVPAGGTLTIPAATLTPGTHLFFCAIHPWMQETVTVS